MNILSQMLLASSAITRLPMVFNPGNAGWKLAADGKTIEMKDGNPIWVDADGTEKVLQQDTITRLNNEAAGHRTRAEKAEADLTKFKGIDPEKAKKAIDTVSKLDAKQLIDAGEVDKVRQAVATEYEGRITEREKAYGELQSKHHGLQIANIFTGSEFVRDNVAIPRDMFQAYFQSNFKINPENGAIEVYGKDGNRVFSKKNMGQFAEPDEALEILVNTHPQKDAILRPSGHSGSGNNGNGGNRPGQRVMKRSEFDQISMERPAEAANIAGKMRSGEITIVD